MAGWWPEGFDADLLLRYNCASLRYPWSITTSALPNATLAGVIAGFLITASAFLFDWKQDGKFKDRVPNLYIYTMSRRVHALTADRVGYPSAAAMASAATRALVRSMWPYTSTVTWMDSCPRCRDTTGTGTPARSIQESA